MLRWAGIVCLSHSFRFFATLQDQSALQQLSTVSIVANDHSASEAGDHGQFTVTLAELRATSEGVLPGLFG